MLGHVAESLDIGDLPIVPGNMRATDIFWKMRQAIRTTKINRFLFWKAKPGNGMELIYLLITHNKAAITLELALAAVGAALYYGPPWFLRRLVRYLEEDPERVDPSWGFLYAVGLFSATILVYLGMSATKPTFSI
jgi:hypothetical protein